jgi:YHYH protein
MSRLFSSITAAMLFAFPVVVNGTVAFAHDDHRKVGDGKVSSKPKRGYIYSCQQTFNPNAPGAKATGDWLVGNKVYPDLKPTVDGRVKWGSHSISIKVEGDERVVRANGLPKHKTGVYPIQASNDAYDYDTNPNSIQKQSVMLRLPAEPEFAAKESCVPMGMIGFTVKGVALYNGLDAAGRDAPAYEIQDKWGGHPEADGEYHYHHLAPGMKKGTDSNGHSKLVGYALDGFGIYGEYEKKKDNGKKKEIKNKKLDACHGHVGTVMWDGEEREMYHYHMTFAYPFSIGCFRGTPVSTN